jgi:hypothetical protein
MCKPLAYKKNPLKFSLCRQKTETYFEATHFYGEYFYVPNKVAALFIQSSTKLLQFLG